MRALGESGTVVCWTQSHAQIADRLTKAIHQAFALLHAFLQHQPWKIVYDERSLSVRKRAALGKGILDEVHDEDHDRATSILESRKQIPKTSVMTGVRVVQSNVSRAATQNSASISLLLPTLSPPVSMHMWTGSAA